MSDDQRTREIVDGLRVQPESPRFFDDVWARTQRRESDDVRRWKRAAFVFAGVALAAVAGALVLATAPSAASSVVDRTLVCTNVTRAGLPVFKVSAMPTGNPPAADENGNLPKPPPGYRPVPSLVLQTGDVYELLRLSTSAAGYQLDNRRCVPQKRKPALSPRGLPAPLTLRNGDFQTFAKRCTDVARIVVRVRIESDSLGVPRKAQVIVTRAKSGKPLVYVDWSRLLVKGYAAPGCETTTSA